MFYDDHDSSIMAHSTGSIAESQWHSFCSNVVAEWSGLWTFWEPHTGKVRRSFNCLRSFKALNEEQTIIKHQNISNDVEQRSHLTGPWEIRKEDTDENGLFHPAKPHIRAVLHLNGGGAWAPREIADNKMLAFELFLCRGEFRCSVILSYDESKQLRLFGTIREKQTKATTEIWSSNTELRKQEGLPYFDANDDFIGEEKTLDQNLQLGVESECKWDKAFWFGNKEIGDGSENWLFKFLPDGICLYCPGELCSNSFSLRACMLFPNGDEKELQELTVSYVDGRLKSIKQGLYY